MHLIFLENDEDRELTTNKCICSHYFIFSLVENLYCPMEKLSKSIFIEKWKSISNEVKFTIVNNL